LIALALRVLLAKPARFEGFLDHNVPINPPRPSAFRRAWEEDARGVRREGRSERGQIGEGGFRGQWIRARGGDWEGGRYSSGDRSGERSVESRAQGRWGYADVDAEEDEKEAAEVEEERGVEQSAASRAFAEWRSWQSGGDDSRLDSVWQGDSMLAEADEAWRCSVSLLYRLYWYKSAVTDT
jgi:hypothetical protein